MDHTGRHHLLTAMGNSQGLASPTGRQQEMAPACIISEISITYHHPSSLPFARRGFVASLWREDQTNDERDVFRQLCKEIHNRLPHHPEIRAAGDLNINFRNASFAQNVNELKFALQPQVDFPVINALYDLTNPHRSRMCLSTLMKNSRSTRIPIIMITSITAIT